MKKRHFFLILLAATLAGFSGGFLSNQIFKTKSAFAQKAPSHRKVLIAEEFRVVDRDGKILASLGTPGYLPDMFPHLDASQAAVPQLRLGQESGYQIILAAGAAAGSTIMMKDEKNVTRTVIGNTEFHLRQSQLTYKRQVSSIVLFDRLGRFLWSAPGGVVPEGQR